MKNSTTKPSKRGGGRNLHAIAPIMRKGGIHDKSESAKRTAARRELRDIARHTMGRQGIGRGYSADADSRAA